MPEVEMPELSPAETREIITEEKEAEKKEQIPQVDNKSGLSDEYMNQLIEMSMALDPHQRRYKLAKRFYEDLKATNGFKKYTEMFPESKYENVVNNQNREEIIILDHKIEDLWEVLEDIFEDYNETEPIDQEKLNAFNKIYQEIDRIVRTEKRN
jgi:hypothetical protein